MLPWLVPGANKVTASCGRLAPGTEAVVTLSYCEATVANPAKRQRWDGTGVTLSAPRTITREFSGTETTFDAAVAGNTPPKMLFLERAVRSTAGR